MAVVGVLGPVTILAAAHEPLATGTGGGARFGFRVRQTTPLSKRVQTTECQLHKQYVSTLGSLSPSPKPQTPIPNA